MEPEHHDPWSEGTQRALERLMALGVLVEAGSRLAAENARHNAGRVEQDLRDRADREVDAREAQGVAAAEASRRAREWARFAADGDRLREHLAGLPLQEVARHWVQAARQAESNPTAATVRGAAEEDLRRRVPGLMDFYDQHREDGVPREPAMAAAVRDFTQRGRGPARRHGGHPAVGALTRLGEELSQEVTRLAGGLNPIERSRLLRNLEDHGWSAESLAVVETLLERAGEQRRAAAVHEPPTAGPGDQHAAAAADGRADDLTAHAAALATTAESNAPAVLAAQSFPLPAQRALTAHPRAMPVRAPSTRLNGRRAR